jgi:seryl-tRNA synthetase
LQDNAELKGQVRSAEKLRAEAEQAFAAAEKAHGEEANRLRRISKKTAEDLEEAQLELKALRERLETLELSEQQALRELQAATTQLDALQSRGVKVDSAINENTELKQVRVLLLIVGTHEGMLTLKAC